MIAPFRATSFGGNRYSLYDGDVLTLRDALNQPIPFAMAGYGTTGRGADGDHRDRVDRIIIPAPLPGAANTFTLTHAGNVTVPIRQDTPDATNVLNALNALAGLGGNVAVDFRGPGVWDVRFIRGMTANLHGGGIAAIIRQDAGAPAVPIAPVNRWPGDFNHGTKRGGENQFDVADPENANVVMYDFDNTAGGVNAFGTVGLGGAETGIYSGDSGGPALMYPGPVPVIAGVLSWGDNDPARNMGGVDVDVTRYWFVHPVEGSRRWPDGSIGEHGGYTRIAPYLPYLNGRTSEQIDLVLDMNYQTFGLTDAPGFPGAESITIEARNVGGSLEILVSNSVHPSAELDGLYYRGPAANVKSLTLRGSSDNDTFRIIGDLGISGGVFIDGRGGSNDVIYDYQTGAGVGTYSAVAASTEP